MHNKHEKSPHGFEKKDEGSLETQQVIQALTPEAIIKLKFFDGIINSAVKEGQIDAQVAKLAKLTATAVGRTITIH